MKYFYISFTASFITGLFGLGLLAALSAGLLASGFYFVHTQM